MTNRDKVNFQKWDFFDFSSYFYYKLCRYRSTKKSVEHMVYFIYSQQCIKIISSRKMCGFISSVFKKIIPKNNTPTFQEVGGVTQPRIFCRWLKYFS